MGALIFTLIMLLLFSVLWNLDVSARLRDAESAIEADTQTITDQAFKIGRQSAEIFELQNTVHWLANQTSYERNDKPKTGGG